MVKVTDLSQIFRPALPLFWASWSCRRKPLTCSYSQQRRSVISGSLHPHTGGQEESLLGEWGQEHFWFLLLNPNDFLCLCPYDLEWNCKKKLHMLWWKTTVEGKKEEISKLSCVCLLHVKAVCKLQNTTLINIYSCRHETIKHGTSARAAPNCALPHMAFRIKALACWGGGWWTDPEIRLKFQS